MLLLIDKPKGMTSHDVVDAIRDITGKDKVGHGGTLDPQATGLLIIGITRQGTKKLGKFQRDAEKKYRAVIRLGVTTTTHDIDGEVTNRVDPDPIDHSIIKSVLEKFVGTQKQIPPQHSAVKIDGERAHKIARQNKDVDVPPRVVTVGNIDIVSYDFPDLEVNMTVSSGTYIRSIARDIGEELGCGAYLKSLHRLQINNFSVDQANNLNDITENNWRQLVINKENERESSSDL